MSTHVEPDSDTRVSSLMSGILQDAKQLFIQQMTLFQVEIKNDVRRTIYALIPLMAGVVVLFVAVLILAHSVAHFLSWYFPDLPLWGGLGIVGGVICLVGIGLLLWSKIAFSNVNPLPEKSMEGLKENIQWKTKT
jgi:multisubunit Na+/H+ antiporter MnhB subunit